MTFSIWPDRNYGTEVAPANVQHRYRSFKTYRYVDLLLTSGHLQKKMASAVHWIMASMKVSELGPLAGCSNLAWGSALFQLYILLVWALVAYNNLILATRHLGFSNTYMLTPTLQGHTHYIHPYICANIHDSKNNGPLFIVSALNNPCLSHCSWGALFLQPRM